jgi:hypothetical protein
MIEARIEPAADVARARVFFRGAGDAWYFVEMRPMAGTFAAALPKPLASLKQLSYYIEALTRESASNRTPDHVSAVVPKGDNCSGKRVAAIAAASSVALGVPSGAAAVPLGFSASGVSTSAAMAGATSAAAGGGHTGVILLGVAAAGAAVGTAVVLKGRSEDSTIVVRGYVYLGECTCTANNPPPYPFLTAGPIQGAVATTTIDATSATTDTMGYFELRTTDPKPGYNSYTGSVTAPGCSNSTGWQTGHSADAKPLYFTLTCSNGPPPLRGCACAGL